MNILEIFINSLFLIITFNHDLWEIIILSLYVSFIALIIGSVLGILTGYYLAIKIFIFKNILLIFINSLMGIPPVVVGLIVYFVFASGGPLGVFEVPPFDEATSSCALTVAMLTRAGGLVSIAGGGDTVSALNNAGASGGFSYVSVAGGAFLEWIEGKSLPGITALNN